MKKLSIAVAVAACLGALVATAGTASPAGTYHDPPKTAMYALWWSESPGMWDYVEGQIPKLTYMDEGTPVPCGWKVMVSVLWVGQGYLHTMIVPDVDMLKLTITKHGSSVPVVAQTWLQGRAAWGPVFAWDGYWEEMIGPAPPFDPRLNIGTFGIKWENVYTQARLGGPGVYHVTVDEDFRRVYYDLTQSAEGGNKPTRIDPYKAQYTFDIHLQACS